MTDIEKLKAVFVEFGIQFDIEPPHDNNSHTMIVVSALGSDHKVDGYMGFYCRFNFDEKGKFIQMGIFE